MGTFNRMEAELHSRWFDKRVKLKEYDALIDHVNEWRVVNAYYAVDEDNPITVATLVIRPVTTHLDIFDRHVEVNEVIKV